MDWLIIIIQVVLIPILSSLTAYLVVLIRAKAKELAAKVDNDTLNKYLTLVADTVTECVIATNQTYVENLKKENAFTKEAQLQALEQTKQAVLDILSEDAKTYLMTAVGDLDVYLKNLIEAEVNKQK